MKKTVTQTNAGDMGGMLMELQLTRKTALMLERAGIQSVADLLQQSDEALMRLGLDQQRRVEVREVLASRGL